MAGGLGVHLCGSVPLDDSETVFRTVAARLPGLRRIPDGETGERDNWVMWQLPKLRMNPDLEIEPTPNREYGATPRLRAKAGTDPASVRFGALGYAAAATESWRVFSRLRDEGVIPADVRFQISLPTPVAVTVSFIADDHKALERGYRDRLLSELAEITATVPADDLAVQWDCAVEFAVLEGVMPAPWLGADHRAQEAEIAGRLVDLGDAVPTGVELGYHLCYGDFGHEHFAQPADAGRLVSIANRVSAGVGRPIDWVHLPVPRDRHDLDYFRPLERLSLSPETALFLGLVHHTDGVAGGRRRIAAARRFAPEFGIATECGMGRRPADQIPGLLDLHVTLANAS